MSATVLSTFVFSSWQLVSTVLYHAIMDQESQPHTCVVCKVFVTYLIHCEATFGGCKELCELITYRAPIFSLPCLK